MAWVAGLGEAVHLCGCHRRAGRGELTLHVPCGLPDLVPGRHDDHDVSRVVACRAVRDIDLRHNRLVPALPSLLGDLHLAP